MTTIPQKELRNNVGKVLRRAEAGEQFTITVSGRPVAQLGPLARRRWAGPDELRELARAPAPLTLLDDLAGFAGGITDPYQ